MFNLITLQMDTFCATGCSYCLESTKTKNKSTYDLKSLDYLFTKHTKKVILFGGDTYYDKEQYLKYIDYVTHLPHLKFIQSISEARKVKRDMSLILEANNRCVDNNKVPINNFSLDLFGIKSGFYVNELNELFEKSPTKNFTFNLVLTIENLLDKNLENVCIEFIKHYNHLSIPMQLYFSIDYASIFTYNPLIVDGIYILYETFFGEENKNINPILLKEYYCPLKNGNGLFIGNDETLVGCGKLEKNYDIQGYKIGDSIEVIKESLLNFKSNQNNNENYKLCQECEANSYCNRCPKFFSKIKNFNGNTNTCLFFKTIYEIEKKLNWK